MNAQGQPRKWTIGLYIPLPNGLVEHDTKKSFGRGLPTTTATAASQRIGVDQRIKTSLKCGD